MLHSSVVVGFELFCTALLLCTKLLFSLFFSAVAIFLLQVKAPVEEDDSTEPSPVIRLSNMVEVQVCSSPTLTHAHNWSQDWNWNLNLNLN